MFFTFCTLSYIYLCDLVVEKEHGMPLKNEEAIKD